MTDDNGVHDAFAEYSMMMYQLFSSIYLQLSNRKFAILPLSIKIIDKLAAGCKSGHLDEALSMLKRS